MTAFDKTNGGHDDGIKKITLSSVMMMMKNHY